MDKKGRQGRAGVPQDQRQETARQRTRYGKGEKDLVQIQRTAENAPKGGPADQTKGQSAAQYGDQQEAFRRPFGKKENHGGTGQKKNTRSQQTEQLEAGGGMDHGAFFGMRGHMLLADAPLPSGPV